MDISYLLSQARKNPKQFRDLVAQVRQDCKDSDTDKSEARHLVYKHYAEQDPSKIESYNSTKLASQVIGGILVLASPIIGATIARNILGGLAIAAPIIAAGYTLCEIIPNHIPFQGYARLSQKEVSEKARLNRMKMNDSEAFRKYEQSRMEKDKEWEAEIANLPWYERLAAKGLNKLLGNHYPDEIL